MAEYIIKIETEAVYSQFVAQMLNEVIDKVVKRVPQAQNFEIKASEKSSQTRYCHFSKIQTP